MALLVKFSHFLPSPLKRVLNMAFKLTLAIMEIFKYIGKILYRQPILVYCWNVSKFYAYLFKAFIIALLYPIAYLMIFLHG